MNYIMNHVYYTTHTRKLERFYTGKIIEDYATLILQNKNGDENSQQLQYDEKKKKKKKLTDIEKNTEDCKTTQQC